MTKLLIIAVSISFSFTCYSQESKSIDYDKIQLHDGYHLKQNDCENLIKYSFNRELDSVYIYTQCELISISTDSINQLKELLSNRNFEIIQNKSIINVLTTRTDISRLVCVEGK